MSWYATRSKAARALWNKMHPVTKAKAKAKAKGRPNALEGAACCSMALGSSSELRNMSARGACSSDGGAISRVHGQEGVVVRGW